MPRRDGTGPMVSGSETGRGLGLCSNGNLTNPGKGLGLGHRRGFRRNMDMNPIAPKVSKDFLIKEKELLKSKIGIIDKKLGALPNAE